MFSLGDGVCFWWGGGDSGSGGGAAGGVGEFVVFLVLFIFSMEFGFVPAMIVIIFIIVIIIVAFAIGSLDSGRRRRRRCTILLDGLAIVVTVVIVIVIVIAASSLPNANVLTPVDDATAKSTRFGSRRGGHVAGVGFRKDDDRPTIAMTTATATATATALVGAVATETGQEIVLFLIPVDVGRDVVSAR